MMMASALSAFDDASRSCRIPSPIPPPSTTQTEPPVTARAFADIKSFGVVISGIPAESPARINRLTPNAMRTTTVISTPV